jgi:hypothetical protein
MADNKAPTHNVYTFRRIGRKSGCWEQCGSGWHDDKTGKMGIVIRMLPVGGFGGLVQCLPIGAPPPAVEPQRPDGDDEEN